MAFTPATLGVIVQPIGGGGMRFVSYRSDDSIATVSATSYFTAGESYGLRLHDLIFVSPVSGTVEPYILVVTTVDSDGNVTATQTAFDAELTALAGLDKSDGNIIVGDGTTWVAESGATARTSLGLGSAAVANLLDEDDMASDSATAVPSQQSVNVGKLQKVATRTALKALSTSIHPVVYLFESGREGIFVFDSSDLSTQVAADTEEGIYVAPGSDATGASGAWVRVRREREFNVMWFGASNLGTVDASGAIQAAIDLALVTGGEVVIPAGKYYIGTKLLVDLQGITGGPSTNQRRIRIRGQGMGNTVLRAQTDSMAIMEIKGDNPLTSASHVYSDFSDFAFAGNTPTSRTADGLMLTDVAYLRCNNLSFHNLDACLVNTGCLSSEFDHLIFNESEKGIVVQAGASGPHSNVYIGCEFRALTSLALDGYTTMSGATFINCRVEACGTHGDSATGGMKFNLSGSAGEAGPTFIGGYVENNAGGFDFSVAETASQRVNINFFGTIFNRISSSNYTTNNIVTTGSVDVNLGACTFTSYNTYTADGARPCLNLSTSSRLRDFGCRWENSVEAPFLGQSMPYAGFVDGSTGASVSGAELPLGWSVAQAATGLFTITHNLGHTGYIVTATCIEGNARRVERVVRNSTNFQVKTTDTSETAKDADFGFQLQVLRPAN